MKKMKLLSGFMGILMGVMGACSVSASPVEDSAPQSVHCVEMSRREKDEIDKKIERLNKKIEKNSEKSSKDNWILSSVKKLACLVFLSSTATFLISKGCGLFCEKNSDNREMFKNISNGSAKMLGASGVIGLVSKICF